MNCKYCGKELNTLVWPDGRPSQIPEPCDCEGFVRARMEQEAGEAREKKQEALLAQNKRLTELFKEAMPPAEADLSGFTLANYAKDTPSRAEMLSGVNEFLTAVKSDPHCPGLFFIGTPGTGKTHLAFAIKAALADSIPCLFTTPAKLLSRLRRTFNRGGGDMDLLMRELARVPVLILDDIDKFSAIADDFGASWSHERLFEIINDRTLTRLPIIATSNLSAEQLEKKLTPPIFSRLQGMTKGVVCMGPDHRRTR